MPLLSRGLANVRRRAWLRESGIGRVRVASRGFVDLMLTQDVSQIGQLTGAAVHPRLQRAAQRPLPPRRPPPRPLPQRASRLQSALPRRDPGADERQDMTGKINDFQPLSSRDPAARAACANSSSRCHCWQSSVPFRTSWAGLGRRSATCVARFSPLNERATVSSCSRSSPNTTIVVMPEYSSSLVLPS